MRKLFKFLSNTLAVAGLLLAFYGWVELFKELGRFLVDRKK